jgi:hypothetical protein
LVHQHTLIAIFRLSKWRRSSQCRIFLKRGAQGGELFEGGVDTLAADVALEKGSYLVAD